MILIADSGSTKTEWCVADKGEMIHRIFTAGINPYFQNTNDIAQEIGQNLFPVIKEFPIDTVYFYGAGCNVTEKNRFIIDAISSWFNASVDVQSDLMGAARSLYKHQPGIACILGTGSNSCFYDGERIVDNISPLGFILGDEGSGAVLGKLLVGDCLKNQLPAHLKDKFIEQYQVTPAEILDRVYKQPFPNRYLANFSKFLLENISEPAIYELVYNSFRSFFIRNVMQYDKYADYPVSFIGSIAYYYRDVLKDAAKSLSLRIGQITKTPMDGLLSYHSKI